MLTSLVIDHFAIIESGQISFNDGMTVITGETGAGKSILLDALELALGQRADKALLKDKQKTTISATFDISLIEPAKEWLLAHELNSEDHECILRRVLRKDGSSKAYINGIPATLTQIRDLSQKLIGIYGQHAHYDLLSPKEQLIKLDTYLNEPKLIQLIKEHYFEIKSLQKELDKLNQTKQQLEMEASLIRYQLDELEALNLADDELTELSDKQNQLANATAQLEHLGNICYQLYENDQNLINQLEQITYQINEASFNQNQIQSPLAMLKEANLLIKEAYSEFNRLKDQIEINPEALEEINQRLMLIYDTARKHQVDVEQLSAHWASLNQRLSKFDNIDEQISMLTNQINEKELSYDKLAITLSHKRKNAAKTFSNRITKHIRKLNIPKASFEVIFHQLDKRSETGLESCEFLISFNPGSPLMPIQKVASGGELSRIALTIQVTASEKIAPPTLIFDEVDVGISGATSEIVGQLLSLLSKKAQVLCITHQAQVAAQGDHHLHVSKQQSLSTTSSHVKALSYKERITAIADMIGGVNITEQTLAHASEMIDKFSHLS
ncbi:DNA repair protein RecN [Thiotrichales bacterium 19S11-10]|nr:DNA repair protein RecN [Thiotrichales bacterium 19S11-10]